MIKYVDAMLDGINEATEFIDCNADYLPSTLSEAVKVCTENLLSAIDDGIIRSNDPWELFAIGARGLNAIDEIIERIFGSGIIKE